MAHGAEVPFMRPVELAHDDVPVSKVILHAARTLDQLEGYRPDYIVDLEPTTPFRTTQDIDDAVNLARDKDADAVVSVCLAEQQPYWMHLVTEDGRLTDFMPVDGELSRQQLPAVHSRNSSIYLVRREILLEQETLCPESTYAYVMPAERSFDIDTPWDLYVAELIAQEMASRASH